MNRKEAGVLGQTVGQRWVERRKLAQGKALPPELGGRDGPEPVRYGDWEKKGLAIDF